MVNFHIDKTNNFFLKKWIRFRILKWYIFPPSIIILWYE
jgi:hypothetical protein